MIKKEDLINGSVLLGGNVNYPGIIKGADKTGSTFNIQTIYFLEGIPKLIREILEEEQLVNCLPAKFDDVTPFIRFRNYTYIVEVMKDKGYSITRNSDNTRTVSWICNDGFSQEKIFNEIHLFQKFIFEKIEEYLEVEI